MNMNMNVLGGAGGPGAGQQMMNTGTPGNAPIGNAVDNNRVKLHTYIYDYFLKNEYYDLARSLHDRVEIEHSQQQKQSPNSKQVNGDSMDADNKDDAHGKPADLPLPAVPSASDSSFLFDWWCQFWDCFQAQRGRGTANTKQYLNHVQVSPYYLCALFGTATNTFKATSAYAERAAANDCQSTNAEQLAEQHAAS